MVKLVKSTVLYKKRVKVEYGVSGCLMEKLLIRDKPTGNYISTLRVSPFTGLDYWTEVYSFFGQVCV